MPFLHELSITAHEEAPKLWHIDLLTIPVLNERRKLCRQCVWWTSLASTVYLSYPVHGCSRLVDVCRI